MQSSLAGRLSQPGWPSFTTYHSTLVRESIRHSLKFRAV